VIATTSLFILSLLFTYRPWSKFYYGDVPRLKIVHDTVFKSIPILKHDTIYINHKTEVGRTNNTHINKADKVDIH